MMTFRKWQPSFLTFIVMQVLIVISNTKANDNDLKQQAQTAVRRLAAVRAMMKHIGDEKFLDVPKSEIVVFIKRDLVLHQSYSSISAKRTLHQMWEKRFEQQMRVVADKLDPKGKLDLLAWLRKERIPVGNSTMLIHDIAARQLEDDLINSRSTLLNRYKNARLEIAEKQAQAALSRLDRQLTINPNKIDIIPAARSSHAYDNLTLGILRQLVGKNDGQMLDEAKAKLKEKAIALVNEGVTQYQTQERQLKRMQPKARTPGGIVKESITVLQETVQQREKIRDTSSYKYGVFFTIDDPLVIQLAHDHFEEIVTQVLRTVILSPSRQIQEKAKEMIEKNPRQHQEISDSIARFRSMALTEAKKRIFQTYKEIAKKAGVAFDTPTDFDKLPKDIERALADSSGSCQTAWLSCVGKVESELKMQLKAIRSEIADRQMEKYCPDLNTWRPAESQLHKYTLQGFDFQTLWKLPIWRHNDPSGTELLKEARDKIFTLATEKFRIGHDAISGQRGCVAALKSELLTGIRSAPERGADFWEGEYINRVTQRWKGLSSRRLAIQAYPSLFQAVEEQIQGIVREILRSEVIESQRRILNTQKKRLELYLNKDLVVNRATSTELFLKKLHASVLNEWQNHALAEIQKDLAEEIESEMRSTVRILLEEYTRESEQNIQKTNSIQIEFQKDQIFNITKRSEIAYDQDIILPEKSLRSRKPPENLPNPSTLNTFKNIPAPSHTGRDVHHEEPLHVAGSQDRDPTFLSGAGSHPRGGRIAGSDGSIDNASTNSMNMPGNHDGDNVKGGSGGVGENTNTGDTEKSGPDAETLRKLQELQDALKRYQALSFFLLLLIVILLIIVFVLLRSLRGQRRQAILSSFPEGRFDSLEKENAALAQLKLALDCVYGFQLQRPLQTLEDFREAGQALLEEIRLAWKQQPEYTVLPELQYETAFVAYGGIFVVSGQDQSSSSCFRKANL